MIVQQTFYAVKCDNCGKIENNGEIEFWSDEETAIYIASDSEFYIGETIHFCVDCHEIDDDDNLIIYRKD